MAWTATISSKAFSQGMVSVVVVFANGGQSVTKVLVNDGTDGTWPESEMARYVSQFTAAEAKHTAVSVGIVPLPPPDPLPPTDPTTPPQTPPVDPHTRTLLGGWRVPLEFARGAMAIDFDTNTVWIAGIGDGSSTIYRYTLPPIGAGDPGTNFANWPALSNPTALANWWSGDALGSGCYCNGLAWWGGKLWAAPRKYYDISPPATMKLFASDGTTKAIALPRQKWSGFVKRAPGLDPYLGCGGYESGQGTVSGPTLALLDTTKKIEYFWPELPGAALVDWNKRAPRPTNYYPAGHVDSWVAWEPRIVAGVLEGRWACDVIRGGGLVLPEGVTYWPLLGTGPIYYSLQAITFSTAPQMYTYRYDGTTFAFREYFPFDNGGVSSSQYDPPLIGGQELDASGNVYLCQTNSWTLGAYRVCPVIKKFG